MLYKEEDFVEVENKKYFVQFGPWLRARYRDVAFGNWEGQGHEIG